MIEYKRASRVKAGLLPQGRQLVLRAILSLALAAALLLFMVNRLDDLDLAATRQAFGQVVPLQWAMAGLATAISFWAVGRYDVTLHRHLATRLPAGAAARAGVIAIALAQTVGMGLVTGALVRWRMLPGLGLWAATRLTFAVTLSFMAGWAVVTAEALLLLSPQTGAALPVLTLLAAGTLICAALLAPPIRLFGRVVRWPNALTMARIFVLTAVDTCAAATALWLLCPAALGLAFSDLLPAFLLALGAGLVAGTPGGLGAFEIALLALLPQVPAAPLLGAVLAYRVVYYAIPAVIAAMLALLSQRRLPQRSPRAVSLQPVPLPAQAEWGLAAAGLVQPLRAGRARWLAARTTHGLITLLDPVLAAVRHHGAPAENPLLALHHAAQNEARLLCLYKCNARTALLARRAGFAVLPIAQEAVLNPRDFTLALPQRAGLRRKLRKAEGAGLRVVCGGPLPLAQMAAVAAAWARGQGGERGLSMGRFHADYVYGQRVYLGWQGDRLMGFVTFHCAAGEWVLDLMRHAADAPDGTTQALIMAAIADAGRSGLARLSLAAAPFGARSGNCPAHPLARIIASFAQGAGLAQFKAGFAPRWEPRYIAAPGWGGLALAGGELALAIRFPDGVFAAKRAAIHDDGEDYEFAPRAPTWHMR